MLSLLLPVNDGDWRDDWVYEFVLKLFIVIPRQHAGEETAGKHGVEERWKLKGSFLLEMRSIVKGELITCPVSLHIHRMFRSIKEC